MPNLKDKLFSVVIPVYNTDSSLIKLNDELSKEFGTMSLNFELIFIDD